MATKPPTLPPDEALALRTIEGTYGGVDDIADDQPLDAAALQRMQAKIDQSFDTAWRLAREQAKAESRARAQRQTDLLAFAGDVLRDRIAALRVRIGPELQLAHRNLDDMSDDDLRSLLADLEEIAARTERTA